MSANTCQTEHTLHGMRYYLWLLALCFQGSGPERSHSTCLRCSLMANTPHSQVVLPPQVPVGDMPEGVIVAQPSAPLALPGGAEKGADGVKVRFTWRIENWTAWKDVMETRKIFSRCASPEGRDARHRTHGGGLRAAHQHIRQPGSAAHLPEMILMRNRNSKPVPGRYFTAEGYELRIGAYASLAMLGRTTKAQKL